MWMIVASKNPVKITAAQQGWQALFPEAVLNTQGCNVTSGVPDQPIGDIQTRQGAYNRVIAAQKLHPEADLWIGLEGGVEWSHNARGKKQLVAFAWAVILNKEDIYGEARTACFTLPPAVAHLVAQGYELGVADDMVFGQSNSKQQGGAVGLLTNNVIDRTQYYMHAITLAAAPFLNKSLYTT